VAREKPGLMLRFCCLLVSQKSMRQCCRGGAPSGGLTLRGHFYVVYGSVHIINVTGRFFEDRLHIGLTISFRPRKTLISQPYNIIFNEPSDRLMTMTRIVRSLGDGRGGVGPQKLE